MKRLHSSDSFGEGEEKAIYGRGFQTILDGMEDEECSEGMMGGNDGGGGQGGASGEKKRRLGTEQVRALERSFEVENKLEPERKARLAQDLGLQPRQVAVWFQNRRARWKTKQLERDYTALRATYDTLKNDYDALHHDNEALLAEIKVLKAKLAGEESFSCVKGEPVVSESDNKVSDEPPALIYKDGSSESDSSAVLNDENSPNQGISSSTTSLIFAQREELVTMGFNNSSTQKGGLFYQPHLLKMEENGFLAEDEPCSSLFSDEQLPTLSWYCSDQWS